MVNSPLFLGGGVALGWSPLVLMTTRTLKFPGWKIQFDTFRGFNLPVSSESPKIFSWLRIGLPKKTSSKQKFKIRKPIKFHEILVTLNFSRETYPAGNQDIPLIHAETSSFQPCFKKPAVFILLMVQILSNTYFRLHFHERINPPPQKKTATLHCWYLKIGLPKRKLAFQISIIRCKLLVSGRATKFLPSIGGSFSRTCQGSNFSDDVQVLQSQDLKAVLNLMRGNTGR